LRPLIPRSFYWRSYNGNRTTVPLRHRQVSSPKSRHDNPSWLRDFGYRFSDRNLFRVDVAGNSTRRFSNDDRIPVSAQCVHANRSPVCRFEMMLALYGGERISLLCVRQNQPTYGACHVRRRCWSMFQWIDRTDTGKQPPRSLRPIESGSAGRSHFTARCC
jgi:hypothetical protein